MDPASAPLLTSCILIILAISVDDWSNHANVPKSCRLRSSNSSIVLTKFVRTPMSANATHIEQIKNKLELLRCTRTDNLNSSYPTS